MEAEANIEGAIKDSAFFCIYKSFFAITKKNLVKPIETYINWIMNNQMDNERIILKPKESSLSEISVKEITKIEIKSGYMNSDAETKSQSLNLTRTILKSLIKDVSYTDDFDEENFISAVLTLKFKQKEINKRETLNAAVRLVHDDDIIVTGKNGKRISGSNFFISVTRDIEKLASGRFNEKQIETEMRTILREVNDGKVVS